MAVTVDSSLLRYEGAPGPAQARRMAVSQRAELSGRPLRIGLLNNMAGAAFEATERQFLSLLNVASEEIPVHVCCFALPGLSQAEAGGHQFPSHYLSVKALFERPMDGLIVTGREPKMGNLRDEPYWESFTGVLDWARTNTYSTVWSCLAAHAAILHMDGICRRKSEEKIFGVFECAEVSEHPLTRGLLPLFHVPHSRWNGVAQQDLTDRGYSVLSRIVHDGVDTFIKQEKSLFVFFHGHLEYETDTLMREYRRDVVRYIHGETSTYPQLPRGYFDHAAEESLNMSRDKFISCRSVELIRVTRPMEDTQIENRWRSSAARIYRNWLELIDARKREDESNGVPDAIVPLSVSR